MLLLCGGVLFGTLLLGASPAVAASRTVADSAPAPMAAAAKVAAAENPVAERERLRAELARVQAEIDHLKAGGPGLRSDYALRARMADAEALARRLTDLDAQIKARTEAAVGRSPAGLAPVGAEPLASPTDGPTELEAKADILADQARRTQAQAVALQARIDQVRGRRELHRRASELENDPFAPLEGSRRRLAPGNPNVTFNSAAVPQLPPRTGAPSPPIGVTTLAPTPNVTDKGTGTSNTPSTTSPALQVRDVLDPSASAQVRRNDAAAPLPTDLPSMERQLAALKARAQHLDSQARTLRAQARGH